MEIGSGSIETLEGFFFNLFMHGVFLFRGGSTGHTNGGCATAGGTEVMLRHLPTHCLGAISEAPIPKMLPDPLTQAPEASQ